MTGYLLVILICVLALYHGVVKKNLEVSLFLFVVALIIAVVGFWASLVLLWLSL